jgi:hypothetical protein
MKKIYSAPALLVNETEVQQMVAVSLIDGTADPDGEVLTKENAGWDIWTDEE